MNASEAAKIAKDVREKKAAEAKKIQEARSRKAAADWRKQRANFLIEFRNDIEESIANAVESGKKSIDIQYLAKCGGSRTLVDAVAWYEKSSLRDLVERVFTHFRSKGFSIKMRTFSHEHYVNYESSDDVYLSYSHGCTISWDE